MLRALLPQTKDQRDWQPRNYQFKSDAPHQYRRGASFWDRSEDYGVRPELMLLNTWLTLPPNSVRIPMTTIAMSTRMSAYSTRPWPSSLAKKLRSIARGPLSWYIVLVRCRTFLHCYN